MGRPKAWLPFAGEFLVQRVIRIVRQVVDPVVVVAGSGQDIPELPKEVLIVRDEIEGRGPLQGLATGMRALIGQVDCVYLSSCDVPLLRAEFVEQVVSLFCQVSENRELTPPARLDIAVPWLEGRYHPLAGVYRTSILTHIQQLLSRNQLQLTQLFDQLPTRAIEPHELAAVDPQLESLRNVNTPEEYEAALKALETRRPL
jgi:molybdopterin-guanine dinucleotide biosynthesis protein A